MAPTPAQPVPKFAEGERILCFHGPLIYEAKCLKFRPSEKHNYEYWIHYAGWNKNWDEWVPETRILKYNENNVARQKDLKSQKNVAPKKAKGGKIGGRLSCVKDAKPGDARSEGSAHDPDSRSSTPILDPAARGRGTKKRESPTSPDTDTPAAKRNKRAKQESAVETEQQFVTKVEVRVRIKIPDELKPWLVDDMIMTQKKKKLVVLPADPNVDKVLEMYVLSKNGKGNTSVNRVCSEVTAGLKEYFNAMLQSKLLFKSERQQFADITEKHSKLLPSQIYGSHHLLRLFVRLGAALVYTTLNEKTMALLLATIHDLLKYLASNVALFFSVANYA